MNTTQSGRIFDAASTCQLSYSLQSVPSVLQTSVAGAESSVADIMLTIFNNTQAQVIIDSIVVTLPVGDDASSLVVDVSSITPNAAPSSQWTLNSPSLANVDTTAAYTLLPQSDASAPLAAGAAIVVTLSGVQINHFTGAASIAIDETTSAGEGSTALPVTKYPPGFFFDSLLVNVPNGSELQPVAQVARTTQVTLSWNVSALDPSAIAIFYSSNQGQQGPINPPQVNQSSPIAIYSDTVFTVIVTTTAAGGEPVVRALSTSVSVQQPDAVLNQVQAQGMLSANLGATVTHGLATDSLQASALAVLAGGATVANGLNTDSFAASGSVAMLSAAVAIAPGNGTASTDGYLIGMVGAPSDPSQICIGWLSLQGPMASASCTGGNVVCGVGNNQVCVASNNNTCILPIGKGQAYAVAMTQGNLNTAPANYEIWWVPLGTSSGDEAHAGRQDRLEPVTAAIARRLDQPRRGLLSRLFGRDR